MDSRARTEGRCLADLLQRAALRGPSRTFLSWENGVANYGEAIRAVERQAEALGAAGAARRYVVISAQNRPEVITLWLAAQRADAAAVFVNPALTRHEVERITADLRPALAIVEPEADIADTPSVVRLGKTPQIEVTGLPSVIPAGSAEAPAQLGAVVMTSGSTGRPKYVAVPHAAYVLKGTLNALRLGWREDDCAYCVMPLFHVGAQCETVAPAIAAGAAICLAPRFSASHLWAELEERHCTHLHATGSLLAMALARSAAPGRLGLRRIVASLRQDVATPLAAALPETALVTLYGLTECPLGTLSAPGETYRPGWVGYPYAGWDGLRIVDGTGEAAASGEPGEIQLRNEAVTAGYLGDTEQPPFTPDGWLRTGDLGVQADGGLYLTGRIKEMIRRSGENIAPAEVEEAALAHPAVIEAAAVAYPDAVRDEEVWLCVELAAPLRPEELRSFMTKDLAPYKLPRYIDVALPLPKTSSNKVDKARLRAQRARPEWDATSSLTRPS